MMPAYESFFYPVKETPNINTSPYHNMQKLIARNGKQLTEEERTKLIQLLSDI